MPADPHIGTGLLHVHAPGAAQRGALAGQVARRGEVRAVSSSTMRANPPIEYGTGTPVTGSTWEPEASLKVSGSREARS